MGPLHFQFKAALILFSEFLWVYFAIAMFTSLEWDQLFFPHPLWWVVGAVSGYLFHFIISENKPVPLVFLANLLIVAIIIWQNWSTVQPGSVVYGIFVSVAIIFLYIRSSMTVFKHITRLPILRHFEGNIILYVVFLLMFGANFDVPLFFHLLFMSAILCSLIGLVISLNDTDTSFGDEVTETHTVGRASWFPWVIAAVLLIAVASSVALSFPGVRSSIMISIMAVWSVMIWTFKAILSIISWFFSLFPPPDTSSEMPMTPNPAQIPMPEESQAQQVSSTIFLWIVGGLALVIIGILLWVVSKLFKKRTPVIPSQAKRTRLKRPPFWNTLLDHAKAALLRLQMRWKARFPTYFFKPVYWEFQQIINFGRRKGIPRNPYETPSEYIKRLCTHITDRDLIIEADNTTYNLKNELVDLAIVFTSAYYGNAQPSQTSGRAPFKAMIKKLEKVSISKKL